MNFSLEDLTSKGPRGEDLRKGLAVAEGASDPEICAQLAMICQERGQAMLLIWLVAGERMDAVDGAGQ